MWAIVVVLILVCGHHYIDAHLPSQYKLKKSVGWNAYFLVAVKGFEFLILGAVAAGFLVAILYMTMWVFNVPSLFMKDYDKFTYATDLMEFRLSGFSFWSVLWLSFTVLISWGSKENTRKYYKDPLNRLNGFREIAKDNAIEGIILESLEKMQYGILLFVTLKSRKVYIGMINDARFEGMDTDTLVLIPFISGYRDKDTLTFKIEHYYTDHYSQAGITLESDPISVFQFRHVIPLEQIESFSLFDVNTYISFQKMSQQKNDDNGKEVTPETQQL